LALFSRGSHHKPKKTEIPFSNRRYWHYFPKFSKEDWPTNNFQIEDIVDQTTSGEAEKTISNIEDIHYTIPKFSEQDSATNHFLNRRCSVG